MVALSVVAQLGLGRFWEALLLLLLLLASGLWSTTLLLSGLILLSRLIGLLLLLLLLLVRVVIGLRWRTVCLHLLLSAVLLLVDVLLLHVLSLNDSLLHFGGGGIVIAVPWVGTGGRTVQLAVGLFTRLLRSTLLMIRRTVGSLLLLLLLLLRLLWGLLLLGNLLLLLLMSSVVVRDVSILLQRRINLTATPLTSEGGRSLGSFLGIFVQHVRSILRDAVHDLPGHFKAGRQAGRK